MSNSALAPNLRRTTMTSFCLVWSFLSPLLGGLGEASASDAPLLYHGHWVHPARLLVKPRPNLEPALLDAAAAGIGMHRRHPTRAPSSDRFMTLEMDEILPEAGGADDQARQGARLERKME